MTTSMVATNQHLQPKRHHTNAFLFYSHEQLKHNKEGNHRLNKGVMKNIGDRWKLLSQDEKQKFLDMEQTSSAQYFLDKAGLPKKPRQLFYLDNVSPTFESTYATTRSIPRLNDWGDSQLKKTFRLFRKLGGFHNEVKVTFSKPSQMNDHHVDVVKTEIYDDMRHDIGELKHTMISMNKKIMNWEKKSNAPGDGVDTRQQIGELKDVVYNLHQVIMKHIVRPDQLAAANEGVKAANKIGATAKTKIAHNLMSGKNNGEESDGPSIEFLGVKERALKKGRKGQVIKEKEAKGSPPAEHSLPILGSQRGRGRGGAGGCHGRGRGHTKSSLMHATTQSVDMGDTSSCNDDYVAPITRSEEERRPAPCVRSPYFADGVKKVQKVNQVQTTSMLTDDEEDVAVANMGKFLDNILKPSNEQIIPQSPLIEKTSPSTFLTSEEEVMVKFIFDENCIQGESVISMGLHFTNSVEIGTRQHMCCLKPYAWICTTVINLVVIKLTNKQRTKYPDGRHRIWYMSEYASQMIIKNEEYEGNNERVADLFFKKKGYTGPIDACEEIYIPFNHNKDHWLCLKIDMVQHATYLFDSKPSRRFGEDRKKMGELLLENMHEVLKHAYGLDYVQDVSLFKVDWLSEQPLQFDEDNYDCGLFVIKYMQSAPLLPGFQKFDPIERRRLLVDLLKDVNNRRYLEFRIQFDMYNMRDSRMNAILQGDKASMPGIAAKKCVPFRKRGKK
ncbi:hypothetical protein RHGRI_037321 [Rhododendron griersonianum]|uniref:Ubiquitin-like protease family profile domain-containing protein n=1 Tax=Rhododendron griersonianum TaxID=479676 RepID=A0AAV6HUH8_9ERIC|nr:hypothetical protein RHGRI_037321 [Rhododendron griersonianum]